MTQRIDNNVFENRMSLEDYERISEQPYTMPLDTALQFVQDINPNHLPPNMRNRREALLRRLWEE